MTKEEIARYRKKIDNPVYMNRAIGKIADDWTDKIYKTNLDKNNSEITVAVKQTKGEEKMKNKAIDLHNILFEQLERLNDENIKGEELTQEFKRADAICKVSAQLVNNGRLVYDVLRLSEEYHGIDLPEMLMTKTKQIEAPRQKRI